MNKTIELATQLASQSILNSTNENYHSAEDLINKLTNEPASTMVYLKVFWNSARYVYEWSKGFLTEKDRENFYALNAELTNDIDFLVLNKRNDLEISEVAGIANTAYGSPSVYNEAMTLTLTLSIEKACELIAVLQDKHANTVRSISLIEFYNPIFECEINEIIESKIADAKNDLIETLSKVKRGHYIHLPSIVCLSISPRRNTPMRFNNSEALDELRKSTSYANQSIKESLRGLGVLKEMASNTEYVRFVNKGDFKKLFKAADRKKIYGEFPELKTYFEPASQKLAA